RRAEADVALGTTRTTDPMRLPAIVVVLVALSAPLRAQKPDGEWRAYGRDALGSRYSPLAQITRENVGRLTVAWTFHTGEHAEHRQLRFEATPLVIDGTLYLSTPLGKLIALDATSGAVRWRYDARVDSAVDFGDFANRGVSAWVDPLARTAAHCRRRVYLPTTDGRIIALDAATGPVRTC